MNIKKVMLLGFVSIVVVGCNNRSTKKNIVDKKKVEEKIATPKDSVIFQNKGHELVYRMVQKVGNYQKLRDKKDVVYTYKYATLDGKTDISTEKYIFDGELSHGNYKQHQRTLAKLEGVMEQGFDGKEYWLKIDGKEVVDQAALKGVKFTRPTNFYWFTMFQKLLDPGLKYEFLGETTLEDANYTIVKVSFELKDGKPTDIYQLYINTQTGLVDQFLFTVADYGFVDTPFLMKMEYEEIDGFLIPAKRKYQKSNWKAEVNESPWTNVTWTNIKFDNGLKKEEFFK